MIIVVTLLCVAALSLMIRVYLLEKTTRELAIDIMDLFFHVEDLAGQKIAEEWILDWDLDVPCCKDCSD